VFLLGCRTRRDSPFAWLEPADYGTGGASETTSPVLPLPHFPPFWHTGANGIEIHGGSALARPGTHQRTDAQAERQCHGGRPLPRRHFFTTVNRIGSGRVSVVPFAHLLCIAAVDTLPWVKSGETVVTMVAATGLRSESQITPAGSS
jgi:hypothetical protein